MYPRYLISPPAFQFYAEPYFQPIPYQTNDHIFYQVVQEHSPDSLYRFFNYLLICHDQGQLAGQEIVKLLDIDIFNGQTLLQKAMVQHQIGMTEVIIWMFCELKARGILTPQKLFELIANPDRFGKSAYHYAVLSNYPDHLARMVSMIDDLLKNNEISSQHFINMVTQRDANGISIMVSAFRASQMGIMDLYFLQWGTFLERNMNFYTCFARELIAPYKDKKAVLSRTPFLDVIQSGRIERLDVYFTLIRCCLARGATLKEQYVDLLIGNDSCDFNPLEYIFHSTSPQFLARYLQELEFCSREKLLSSQQLRQLFNLYRENKGEKLEFNHEMLTLCYNQVVENEIDNLITSLPGLQAFNSNLLPFKQSSFLSYFSDPDNNRIRQSRRYYPLFFGWEYQSKTLAQNEDNQENQTTFTIK